MALFFPEGPVESGQTIMMGHWDGVNLYILVDTTRDEDYTAGMDYVFERVNASGSTVATLSQTTMSRAVHFQIEGTRQALTFREVFPYPGGWLGSIPGPFDNAIAARSTSSVRFKASQDIYREWDPPAVLLAGARYTLEVTTTEGVLLPLSFIVSTGGPYVTSSIVLPLTYYHSCNSTSCDESNSDVSAVLTAYCSLRGTVGIQGCESVDGPAWTTVEDAVTAHVYTYCAIDTYCQDTCKSPCENGETCTYDGSKYTCGSGGESIFSGEWWGETWFIVVMVGLALIILIVVVTVSYVKVKQKREREAGLSTGEDRKERTVRSSLDFRSERTPLGGTKPTRTTTTKSKRGSVK